MAQKSYYDSDIETYKIEINWIRHGESCANLDVGSYKDKKSTPPTNSGYGKVGNEYESEAVLVDEDMDEDIEEHKQEDLFQRVKSGVTASNYWEPNLSYIGMNQAINLGTDFFSTRNNPKNIYISSGLTRTITTALLALRFIPEAVIYVVPYINEIGNIAQTFRADWQNTAVKSSILKKKILFIKNWLDINWITRFDDIEIINFLITIYEIIDDYYSGGPNYKQRIIEVLNCRKNRQCRDTNMEQLQELVLLLINDQYIISPEYTYLKREDRDKYDFVINTARRIRLFIENINIYKRGPTVNFEIYDYYEKLRETPNYQRVIPDTTLSNIDFFLSDVLKVIHRDIRVDPVTCKYPTYLQMLPDTDREPITIYAFVHGSLIRDMWKRFSNDTYEQFRHPLEEMMNTFIVSDTITLRKISNKIINHDFKMIDYKPVKIRSSYNNFEKFNKNVCNLNSIKGIINFQLGDPTRDHIHNLPPAEDVQFFYPITGTNYQRIYRDDLPLQIAGYKKKYLKYKQKYLDQKKI